jgi:hypothetical protein
LHGGNICTHKRNVKIPWQYNLLEINGLYAYTFSFKVLSAGSIKTFSPIPVAAQSKVWDCGRSLAAIAGSNPAGSMDIFIL